MDGVDGVPAMAAQPQGDGLQPPPLLQTAEDQLVYHWNKDPTRGF
jgi:hypothetical protein